MKHLFTYGPVSLEDAQKVELKETEIGLIPKDWEVVRLEKVANFSRGISWNKSEETKDPLKGKLVLSIPNIEDGKINYESKFNHYIIKRIPESKKLKIGDILFVGSSGSVKNIGRNVLIEELPFEEISFASFTFKATIINKEKAIPKFFYMLAKSKWFRYEEFSKRAADGKYNFQLKEFVEQNLIPFHLYIFSNRLLKF